MLAKTKRSDLAKPGQIEKIASTASRRIAEINDVRELRKTVDNLDKIRKVVGAVTGKRADINRIAVPMVSGIVKAGRMLREMAVTGERSPGGEKHKAASRRDTQLPTVKDLGFTRARAQRWQLAAMLPDEQREALKEKILDSDDDLWSLGALLRAAKDWLGKDRQLAEVEPSEATITLSSYLGWLPLQPECDLLLTDPPYSTDIDDIEAFAADWLPRALGKVKATGRAYICIGAYPRELSAYLSIQPPPHLIFSQVLVWTYRNRVGPSPTHDYKLNWQAILYYRGQDAPALNCSRAVSDYPDLSEQFTVQDVNLPDPRRHEARLASWHAWQKPTELCERFVKHASQPGQLILDPFAGTGSFLLAAASLGREARGCDKDKKMVAIAKKRGCHVG